MEGNGREKGKEDEKRGEEAESYSKEEAQSFQVKKGGGGGRSRGIGGDGRRLLQRGDSELSGRKGVGEGKEQG